MYESLPPPPKSTNGLSAKSAEVFLFFNFYLTGFYRSENHVEVNGIDYVSEHSSVTVCSKMAKVISFHFRLRLSALYIAKLCL